MDRIVLNLVTPEGAAGMVSLLWSAAARGVPVRRVACSVTAAVNPRPETEVHLQIAARRLDVAHDGQR